ncbi:ArsR/SmtB family transcription factor [Nonomuraea monospora]
MRVCLPASAAGAVVFGCSPALEALRSLHVLGSVRRHPLHISWALRTRERLDAELRNEIDQFAYWCQYRPLALPHIWRPDEVSSWPEELVALREAPLEHYAEHLLAETLAVNGRLAPVRLEEVHADPVLRERAENTVRQRHPASVRVLRELIEDPERSRQRFADFLSAYWESCMAGEWPNLQRYLLADIAARSRTGFQDGLMSMLEGLAPQLRVAQEGPQVSITLAPARDGFAPLEMNLTEQDRLVLVPSHFAWPLLTIGGRRELHPGRDRQSVQITYALDAMQRTAQPPAPSEELLKLLRAAAHPTRLQILQLLAGRSRSTRELAGLIGLTEPAISKHLKLLAEAGWAEPERHSYYVYYRLVRATQGRFTDALDRLFG